MGITIVSGAVIKLLKLEKVCEKYVDDWDKLRRLTYFVSA